MAPISMANTASEIRSPAPAPTMPQPSRRSFAGSMIHLVRPSVRPTACAAAAGGPGELGHGDACGSDARLRSSVNPAQAISGSVKTTAGMARGSKAAVRAGKGLDGRLALVARLVGQHRLAGHVADGQDVRVGRAALAVDDEEALRIDLDFGVLQAQAVAVGPAAHREQHAAELPHLLRSPSASKVASIASFLSTRRRSFAPSMDRLELLLESFVQRADQVAVGAGQQAVGHSDDGNAAAQRGVDGRPFPGRCSRRRPPAAIRARRPAPARRSNP